MTLDEAELVGSVLAALDTEVNKRDRGMSATHEVGVVRISLLTERAREFSALVRRLANEVQSGGSPAPKEGS